MQPANQTRVKTSSAVSSSWPPLLERGIRGKFDRQLPKGMAPYVNEPSHFLRRLYTPMDEVSEFNSLSLTITPPTVEVDNDSDAECSLVKVDSANRRGCLLEVVQALTDFNLTIRKAHISSDNSWFVDVFHVVDEFGRKVDKSALIPLLMEALATATAPFLSPTSQCNPQIAKKNGSQSEASIGGSLCTAVELLGEDHPGLLSEVSTALTDLRVSVEGAWVWTHKKQVACVLHVVDPSTMGPIRDQDWIARIKDTLSPVGDVRISNGLSFSQKKGGTTSTERRLHQLMASASEWDGSQFVERNPWQDNGEPLITVRNCGDTFYSVVNVRCVDRPRLLFDTVCTLTDMQYVVYHATIDSHNGIAFQEYYLRNMNGLTVCGEEEKNGIINALHAAIERRTTEGTCLEINARDRLGLLSEVTRIFKENGLSVMQADVETSENTAVDVFYLTNTNGGPVDPKVLDTMQKILGPSVLRVRQQRVRAGGRNGGQAGGQAGGQQVAGKGASGMEKDASSSPSLAAWFWSSIGLAQDAHMGTNSLRW